MPVTVALMIATVEFLIATVEFLTPFWIELGLFVRQRKETHPVSGQVHATFFGINIESVVVVGCCSKPPTLETESSGISSIQMT